MQLRTLIAFLMLSACAFAQGGFYQDRAEGRLINGNALVAIPGATVTVCSDAACASPVAVFSDAPLTQSIGSTFTADANGNFSFFAHPGQYYCQVAGSGFSTAINPCQVSVTLPNLAGILFVDGVKYANIAAAVTAAGSNQTLIVIPPSYTGVDCPAAASAKLTFLDYRGGLNICTQNSVSYGTTSGAGLYSLLRGINTTNGGVTVAGYFQNFVASATGGASTNADGGSFEVDLTGVLSGIWTNAQGAENPVIIASTGGTVSNAVGQVGYVNTIGGSTTNITTVKGTWGLGCNSIIGSGTITNCYGTYSDEQRNGTSRNYALAGFGPNLLGYGSNFNGAALDAEDSSHVTHRFIVIDGSGNTQIQAIGTNGLLLKDSAGNSQQTITSTGTKFSTGIGNDGSGLKHIRGITGCATSASAGATCDTTVTWTTAFADTSYTVTCSGDAITSGVPVSGGINSKLAASIKFRTVAATAAAAQFTNVECIAVHD